MGETNICVCRKAKLGAPVVVFSCRKAQLWSWVGSPATSLRCRSLGLRWHLPCPCQVGSCYDLMTRSKVHDVACNGKYTELAVWDVWEGVVLQLECWAEWLTTTRPKKSKCYKCYSDLWIAQFLYNCLRKGKWMQIWKLHCDESCFRSGSLKTIASELAKNMPYLMGKQEIRWDRGGTKPVEDWIFFCMEEGKWIIRYGQGVYVISESHKQQIRVC